VTERGARVILGLLSAGLVVIALTTDLSSLSGGRFWGDGATYHAMAWSLAEDHDIRYEAKDVFRSRREFSEGPQGIFLKRSSGGLMVDTGHGFPWLRRVPANEPRIYFAKPFVYPLFAAPLVRLFGTRGLLLTNALALAVALLCGYGILRLDGTPGGALGASAALVLGTVAPLYLVWPAPEALGVGLAAVGLWAWRYERPWLAAIVFGIAAYSKPPNVLLALPLCLAPLLEGGRPFLRRLLEGTRRGAAVLLVAAALYGVNWGATGEWNYQGGRERKTFYGKFPFESYGVTFGNSGIWMSTNQLGPRVEGKDDVAASQGAEPPRSRDEYTASFVSNLGYFWIGRFGGVVPYFFPVAVALFLFAFPGPRSRVAWLALAALAVSEVAYIAQIPDNWYGGSGTVGNRYFLNLLPLAFLLVPRGREFLVAASGLVSLALFTGGLLTSPMHHSLSPGSHATRWPFRWLPAELTMLNDLAVFNEPWRKKVPVGDPYGDPRKPGSGDPSAYFLYFPDDGTFGREELEGRLGFWVRGERGAEVFLRALEPVRKAAFLVTGGPSGDDVRLSLDGREASISLRPHETRNVVLEPGPGFPYKDSFVHILRLRSARGGLASHGDSERWIGHFVSASLDVERRAPH
jgi:hypothetical protein